MSLNYSLPANTRSRHSSLTEQFPIIRTDLSTRKVILDRNTECRDRDGHGSYIATRGCNGRVRSAHSARSSSLSYPIRSTGFLISYESAIIFSRASMPAIHGSDEERSQVSFRLQYRSAFMVFLVEATKHRSGRFRARTRSSFALSSLLRGAVVFIKALC